MSSISPAASASTAINHAKTLPFFTVRCNAIPINPTQKVVVITGATSGIGAYLAQAYAKAGYAIAFNGFTHADAVDEQLKNLPTPAYYQHIDMAQATDIEKFVTDVQSHFQRVDVLINNAGVQHVAEVASFPPEKWDAIIAINLSAAFHMTRLVLPMLQAQSYGRVINIASVHGLVASSYKSAYVAAKHGLIGFTKACALEWAQTAVTCNALCPGWVQTPLVEAQIDAKAKQLHIDYNQAKQQLLQEKQPSGEFVDMESLAQMALLVSSNSMSQMRGSVLCIDGAWTAQ